MSPCSVKRKWVTADKCGPSLQVRSTSMNDNSSRSHTLVTFTVHPNATAGVASSQLAEVDDVALENIATLHLVDLAGSESGRVRECCMPELTMPLLAFK